MGQMPTQKPETQTQSSRTAHDPVCGMTVDALKAKHKLQLDGRTYYFCCEGCLTKFQAHPEDYTGEGDKGRSGAPKTGGMAAPGRSAIEGKRIEYTCPMHPEVVQPMPGACPICGMDLEPKGVSLEEEVEVFVL